MHYVISGSTGLIGSALVATLTAEGHAVTRLVRGSAGGTNAAAWDPLRGSLNEADLEGSDAVVHLAGENVAGRWSAQKKAAIRDSRVIGTRTLVAALTRMAQPPRVLVAASAIGFYGDRSDERLTEASPAGSGFLADVCQEWENAAAAASAAGIRVVHLRIGVVLTPRGGALEKMLPIFRTGVGGRIGHGRQYISWITLEDVVRAIRHAVDCEDVSGPLNATSPGPVTNAEFTKALGRVLGRPTALPVPAFAVRAAMGEMADEMLLASVRVEPQRLRDTGFTFDHPDLEPALRHVLSTAAT